jgi:hypothetical protein
MALKLEDKLKTALDETRLLILAAQILMGFQLNAVFQDRFESLHPAQRGAHSTAFVLSTIAIATLIAPSMHHRIVERGEATNSIHRIATVCAGVSLIPLMITLSLDIYVVIGRTTSETVGVIFGAAFSMACFLCWFVFAWMKRKRHFEGADMEKSETPLHAKIEQMLTEARVLIPGAQALLGFQMAVMLTSGFDGLPSSSKFAYLAALVCIGLALILLITPAALHRISFRGEDSEELHTLGSYFVIAAAAPLAAGMSLDLFVGTSKATGRPEFGAVLAVFATIIIGGLWFAFPLFNRRRLKR